MILAHAVHHAVALHSALPAIPRPCSPSSGEACNTSASEHQYWAYLFWTYLHAIRMPNVAFDWYTELVEWAWVLVLAGGYFVGTMLLYRQQNRRGAATDPTGPPLQDLYAVESYNGYVTERNGPVDPFNWTIIITVTIYVAIIIGGNLLNAQVY